MPTSFPISHLTGASAHQRPVLPKECSLTHRTLPCPSRSSYGDARLAEAGEGRQHVDAASALSAATNPNEAPDAGWYRKALPKAARVYPDHGQLWLTQRELLRGYYRMPEDARRLVEAVFGEDAEPPEGLQASSDRAMAQSYSDRGISQTNAMSLATGYRRQGVDWMSDRSAPSRLGEDTHEVLLARWEESAGGAPRIAPWCDGREHAWEYSTVRVPVRLIADALPPQDDHRGSLIEATKARLPGGGKYALLLVLAHENGAWRADALAPDGRPRRWTYDESRGLLAVEAPGAGNASSPGQSPRM